MTKAVFKGFAAICATLVTTQAFATCYFVGSRTVKGFWIETGLGLVIVPTQNFDNPANCSKATQAIVPETNPQYKQIQASVMLAMATGTPITGYGCDCLSAWNSTYPQIQNFGANTTPQ